MAVTASAATFPYIPSHNPVSPPLAPCVIWLMEHVVIGVTMSRLFKLAVVAALLSNLTACVVVPPAPYYGYGPGYEHHHHEYHRDWDRRW